ncbi:DUF4097 family beta strand repeat-containing protein [Streptococcus dentapri]|uniref:DUF4097 family beta strand repeat-containing protein n=1 Tax=Streptococcus dentapri TaxID=573564 RepID=A0ABV8CYS9_9STRE
MKKWKKILLILGISISLLGALLAVIGFINDGFGYIQEYTKREGSFTEKKLEDFDKIAINSSNYHFVIQEGQDNEAKISYYQQEKTPLKVSVKNHQLDIYAHSDIQINVFKLSDFTALISDQQDTNTVTITVPKGVDITELTGEMSINGLDINHLDIDRMNLSLDAGQFKLNKTTIKEWKLDVDMGSAKITNSNLSDFRFSADSGNLDLDNVNFTASKITMDMGNIEGNKVAFKKENRVSASSGNIDLSLKDHNLTVTSDIDAGNKDITSALNRSKDNFLDISANMGDITVE